MAYGDYGGRVYVQGVSRNDKVDVEPPGSTAQGFAGQFHALLGEGRVLVGLFKQSSVTIIHAGVEVPLSKHLIAPEEAPDGYAADDDYFDRDPWAAAGRPASFVVGGHRIDVLWTGPSDYFVHARLTDPDGTTWTGWSGYGIGAGHTEEGSEEEEARIEVMNEAFQAIEAEIPTGSP